MTREEKKLWKKFIADCINIYEELYDREGFRRAIKIFYGTVRMNLEQKGFTDRKMHYVFWLFDQEYERAKCRIYGMKNLDATNPKNLTFATEPAKPAL